MNGPTTWAAAGVRRRAVLRAGAWAVPAVTVVAAAPAQAASVPPTLLVDAGSSWVELGAVGYPMLHVRDLSVRSSVPLAAGELLLSVLFVAPPGPPTLLAPAEGVPDWPRTSRTVMENPAGFQHAAPVAAGQAVVLPEIVLVVAPAYQTRVPVAFRLTFSSPSAVSATLEVATQP